MIYMFINVYILKTSILSSITKLAIPVKKYLLSKHEQGITSILLCRMSTRILGPSFHRKKSFFLIS